MFAPKRLTGSEIFVRNPFRSGCTIRKTAMVGRGSTPKDPPMPRS